MNRKDSKKNSIEVIYGKQNLKEIVTEMLETIFIEEIQKSKKNIN